MARLPRLTVAGHPHHIILRGNNRQPIFVEGGDHEDFLKLLERYAKLHAVSVHAYVLMSSQLHLLATPADDRGIPQTMQAVGREYVRLFNRRQSRTGTLWEGRYRANLIQAERYLLPCMAYMDLAPVWAGVVAEPAEYPWSSHGHYVGVRNDRLLTPHPIYWQLGNTPFAREEAYAELVHAGVASQLQRAVTDSALGGWALGDRDFVELLQQKTDRRLAKRRPGRPSSVPN